MKTNKATSFVTSGIDIPFSDLSESNFIASYLGYNTDAWEDFIYMLFKEDVETNVLEQHSCYVDTITVDEGVLIKFSIPEDMLNKVVRPFKRGAYSEIDRDYVNNNFPKITWQNGKMYYSPNRQILDKCSMWKSAYEKKWDIILPEGAEVWSKPELKEEIYGYTGIQEVLYEPSERMLELCPELVSVAA